MTTELLLCFGAFWLGAIPFGFLAGKMKGVNLKEHGSGNIGATNAIRVLGPALGVPVLLLDILKGYAPVAVAHHFKLDPVWVVAAGLAAILGHTFSPFLGLKGGKGVATSLGVLLGLSPAIAGLSFVAFLIPFALTRWVSLGSIVGAVTQAVLFFAFNAPLPYRLFGLLAALFVIVKHRSNIERIRNGTENRFGSPRKDA